MSDRDAILAALQASTEELSREVLRLSEPAALWQPSADEWSQHAVLAHIWSGDRYVYLLQLRAIAAANPPALAEIEAEAAQRPAWDPAQPRAELLAACLADRQAALDLLTATDWERRYPLWPMTLGWVAQHMLGHTWEHLSQMVRVRLRYELHELQAMTAAPATP